MNKQRRALFLSHEGGPLPLLGDDAHTEMVSCLREIAERISRPSAIVVNAHWEAGEATVTSGANPSLIYDYSGFPPESYEIKYPCRKKKKPKRLVHWEAAPPARFCHPREEHLLPLQVCYGFAASAGTKSFELQIQQRIERVFVGA